MSECPKPSDLKQHIFMPKESDHITYLKKDPASCVWMKKEDLEPKCHMTTNLSGQKGHLGFFFHHLHQ